MWKRSWLAVAFWTALVGCSGGGRGGDDDDSAGEHEAAVQGCEDYAQTFGELTERCDDDYTEGRDIILDIVHGDCENVLGVRDSDELYGECFPWVAAVPCESIVEGWQLDTSCQEQLLVPWL